MSKEAKILSGVIGLVILGFVVLVALTPSKKQQLTPADQNKFLVKADSYQTGPKNAKVTLVEFGDFQCPVCGAAYPTVSQIEKDYSGKINFVFRHFPLPQHNHAQEAAEAAEAAGAQGKFWEMYNKLYQNQADWTDLASVTDTFVGYAKDLGLDTTKFKDDLANNKYSDKISADQNDGTALRVNATPTFFINGQEIVGNASYDTFKTKIDSLLK